MHNIYAHLFPLRLADNSLSCRPLLLYLHLFAACQTFILQSSAILVLFIPQFRIPFIVVAWGFHIGA